MLLKDKFYKLIKETRLDANNAVYLVSLLPNADVYRGHFPQKPVCPGVCNIELIRECAEMLSGRDLYMKYIKQCRLTAVATPSTCPLLDVSVSLTANEDGQSYLVVARIYNDVTSYMELKGEFSVK